jgi:hypothetical protein
MNDSNVTEIEVSTSGESAVRSVIQVLEQIGSDSQFRSAKVKLSTENAQEPDQDSDRQITLNEADEKSNEKSKSLNPGTSHAEVLYTLNQISDNGPVSTRYVLNHMDLPEGTVYGAMSELHDRGLVNRTDKRNVDNSYGYTVSEAGLEELDRLRQIE